MSHPQPRKPVEPADLFRLKAIQEAAFSPDGQEIVFSLSEVNAASEQEYSALWRLTRQTGELHRLTGGQARAANPAWSPDGTRIAFLSTFAGTPQVYTLCGMGGEPRQLTHLPQGVADGPYWSPNGEWIAFTAGKNTPLPDPDRPYRVTRKIYRFDGMGYLGSNLSDVYIIPAAGGEPRQLTDDDTFNHSLAWSPDGEEILFLANFHPESHNIWPTVKTVNLRGQVQEVLPPGWAVALSAAWTPDGRRIVFAGAPEDQSMAVKIDLWVQERAGGRPERRTGAFNGTISQLMIGDFPVRLAIMGGRSIFVDPDGAHAWTVAQVGGSLSIYRIALAGPEECTPVVTGEFSCTLLDVQADRLLYALSSHSQPRELFTAGLDGTGQAQLTRVNAEVLVGLHLPDVQAFTYTNPHGESIEGWYMLPPVGKPPYPTVLYIHGGPHGAFGHIFHFDFQMLCGAGYAVFFANPRGSSGYGDTFSTPLTGHWGELEYEDLMTGLDLLIDRGLADPNRLGVTGLSYGGYLTCYIVGQTGRFKAAVAENPITDLVSRYATADIGPSFSPGEIGGLPPHLPEVYRRGSPVTFAHRCTTPTLLIQGEADYRCPAEQSEEFYGILRANGCPAEMLRFPKCSHLGAITGPVFVRQAQNEALLGWMNRYVLGLPG